MNNPAGALSFGMYTAGRTRDKRKTRRAADMSFMVLLIVFGAACTLAAAEPETHTPRMQSNKDGAITLATVFDTAFDGYFLTLPALQLLRTESAELLGVEEFQPSLLTRLRLRPTLYFGQNTRLHLEYELASLVRRSGVIGADLQTAGSPRQVGRLNWQLVNESSLEVRHLIDRLYLRHNFEFGALTVGRQRISLGSGRVWNPTDVFNPISPIAFNRIEKDGADAISLSIYPAAFTDVLLLYNAEHEFRTHNGAVRLRSKLDVFDVTLLGGRVDRRALAGLSLAGNLLNAGVRFEAVWRGSGAGRREFSAFILGADNQFTDRVYALVEYHFNGAGAAKPADYELTALATGELLNLGRHYLHSSINYRLDDLASLTLGTIGSFTDGSGFVQLVYTHSLSNESSLIGGLLIPWGGADRGEGVAFSADEFWQYPRSLYVQYDWYF